VGLLGLGFSAGFFVWVFFWSVLILFCLNGKITGKSSKTRTILFHIAASFCRTNFPLRNFLKIETFFLTLFPVPDSYPRQDVESKSLSAIRTSCFHSVSPRRKLP